MASKIFKLIYGNAERLPPNYGFVVTKPDSGWEKWQKLYDVWSGALASERPSSHVKKPGV
jgi:hypothetical protein